MPVFIHAFMKRYSAALAQKKKYDRLSFVRNDYHELQMLFLSPENREYSGIQQYAWFLYLFSVREGIAAYPGLWTVFCPQPFLSD